MIFEPVAVLAPMLCAGPALRFCARRVLGRLMTCCTTAPSPCPAPRILTLAQSGDAYGSGTVRPPPSPACPFVVPLGLSPATWVTCHQRSSACAGRKTFRGACVLRSLRPVPVLRRSGAASRYLGCPDPHLLSCTFSRPLPHCAHRATTRALAPTRRTRSSTPTTPCAPAALASTTTKQRSPLTFVSQLWLKKHTRGRPHRVCGALRGACFAHREQGWGGVFRRESRVLMGTRRGASGSERQ
jgi:hypothetical protein